MRAVIGLPTRAIPPEFAESIDHPGDRPRFFGCRTEVPGFTETSRVAREALGEREIARQRLQHVLPGAHRVRSPEYDGLARRKCPHAVGNESILCPIAAANDVAGPRRSQANGRGVVREKTRVPPGRCHHLRTALAAALRIMTAHRLALAIRPQPFTVLVAFIARDHHDR